MSVPFLFSVDRAVGIDVSSTVISISDLIPEQLFLQYSVIIRVRTVSDSRWTSCIDPWLLSARTWSLRPSQNRLLLSWTFRIDDEYAGRLKWLLCHPCSLWLLLTPWPHWPSTWPPLLLLYLLVVMQPWVVDAPPSTLLISAAGGAVSIPGVMTFYF